MMGAISPQRVGSEQIGVKSPRLQGLSQWERDFYAEEEEQGSG